MTGTLGVSNSSQSLLHQKIDRIMPQGLIGGKNCIGVSNPSIVQFLGHSCRGTIDTMLGGANHFKKIVNYLPRYDIHRDLITGLDVAGQSKYELRSLVNQNTRNKLS